MAVLVQTCLDVMLQIFKIHVRNPPSTWPLYVAINKLSVAPVFNVKACLYGTTVMFLLSRHKLGNERLFWALQETSIYLLFCMILSLEMSSVRLMLITSS